MGNKAQKRLDIEGLRALAVSFVVLYHLFPSELPGGFIGVDVFFVISGFLITQHLAREFNTTGRIRVWNFYARRARRLLPASFLVLIVSLGITVLLAPGNDINRMATGIGASALYVVNWFFAFFSTGYVHAGDSPSIVQQYWSLSVEEQFYLLWPPLIIGAAIFVRNLLRIPRVGNRFLVILLGAITLASFAYSVWASKQDPQQAFYFTTTRAWEFASGGLVALAPPIAPLLRHRLQTIMSIFASWAAIATLGAAAFFINDTMPFPGWRALVPVAATLVLIYVGDRGTDWEPAYISRFAPVVALGGLSYGIYLWHWPLIVGYSWWSGFIPDTKVSISIIIATLAIAFASQRFVENPLRFGAPLKTTKRALNFALVGSLVLVGGSAGVYSWANKQVAAATSLPSFKNVEQIQEAIQKEIVSNTWSGINRFTPRSQSGFVSCNLQEISPCTYGAENAERRLVVIGDSFARSYLPGIVEAFAGKKWEIISLHLDGCPIGDALAGNDAYATKCGSSRPEELLKVIESLNPKLIVAAQNTRYERSWFDSFENQDEAYSVHLANYLKQLANIAPVTVLSSSPLDPSAASGMIAPNCPNSVLPAACDQATTAGWWDYMDAESKAVTSSSATYIDTRDWFCGNTHNFCPEVIDGTYVYAGSGDPHISDQYSRRLSEILFQSLETKP